jgi:hypothetical protein
MKRFDKPVWPKIKGDIIEMEDAKDDPDPHEVELQRIEDDREALREAVSAEQFEQIMSTPPDVRKPMIELILKQYRGVKAAAKKTQAILAKRTAEANARKAKRKRADKSKRKNRG